MDALGLLKLQIEWGADEALDTLPRDRLSPPPAVVAPALRVEVRPAAQGTTILVAPGGVVARAAALAEAAASVEALIAALAGFAECPLQSTAMHLAFVDGNAASGLLAIGDAAGEEEDRTGRPFSGPGGKLLDRMLGSIGLDRHQLLLAHAIPWRPPGNRKPTDLERAMCLPFVLRLIALTRPRRLVLLGGLATSCVLDVPANGVRRLRGRWQAASVPGLAEAVPALPMLNPEQLLATPSSRRDAWADMLTLRVALDGDATEAV